MNLASGTVNNTTWICAAGARMKPHVSSQTRVSIRMNKKMARVTKDLYQLDNDRVRSQWTSHQWRPVAETRQLSRSLKVLDAKMDGA